MKSYAYSIIAILFITFSCSNTSNYNKKLDILEIDKLYISGNLTKAKTDVEKYLSSKKDNEYAWTLLGHIENDLDKDSLAMLAYEKATTINPKLVEAITGKGIVARKNKEYDKAAEYYNKAIKLNPKYAEAYSSLTVIYLKTKKFKKAVEVGLKSYELDNENPVIAANLAGAYHYINDTIQREKFFDIAKDNGYKNSDILRKVFDGEMTLLD